MKRKYRRVKKEVGGPSLTQQNFKELCEINKIVARYRKNEIFDHVNRYEGRYGDFSTAIDYREGIEKLRAVTEMFQTLPAQIRADFENDASKFLEFAQDPEHEEALRELGLLPKIPVTSGPQTAGEEPVSSPKGEKPSTDGENQTSSS